MRGRGWIGEGPRRREDRGISENGLGSVIGLGSILIKTSVDRRERE
jgi:hypothetical protein